MPGAPSGSHKVSCYLNGVTIVMSFTALHRVLGESPGPLTSEMIDAAIEQSAAEATDLDFKGSLPPPSGIGQTDYPKDIAAMANSGGGTIVYGVDEIQKRASARVDVGELTENHERALRSAVVTAISPPVFGLQIDRIGDPGERCVAITVAATVDGPHLIYKNEYFGAPIRNDADTVWMKERQIETMYRARFDERRHATEALDHLYEETAAGRDVSARAWMIAVALPRIPASQRARMSRDDARAVFEDGGREALRLAARGQAVHPLESVDLLNPRPGLRRWNAPNTATSDHTRWREAWASIHNDGSVTLATGLGARPWARDDYAPGSYVESPAFECAVADFLGLLRASGTATGLAEYETRIGIEWVGVELLEIHGVDPLGFSTDAEPIARFAPVRTTIVANAVNFPRQAYEVVLDCVNQAGISYPRVLQPPPGDET